MPFIHSVGTALPPYIFRQDEVVSFVKKIFADFPNLERYLSVFQNTEIKKRHFCVPLEWFDQAHPFPEKNKLYIEEAIKLGEAAILDCLNKIDASFEDVHHLMFISSSGISTPSIDAYIINKLNLPKHIKRTPIWGLGCAGGAVGISRGFDYVRAYPQENVMILTVELCGLTFLRNDLSKSNLIATSLFADGAAAVLISGAKVEKNAKQNLPKILATQSTLYPNSHDVMGWELLSEGLKVIFSRDIPSIVKKEVAPILHNFLAQHGLSLTDVTHHILHPGGTKVMEAYEESLHLTTEQTKHPRHIIQQYGNMSSATVLFVLEKFLEESQKEGEYGLLSALGPGFSSEMVLVQW